MKDMTDHVLRCARLGEAVLAAVRESGLLRKKAGRKRGSYKRRTKRAEPNGHDVVTPRPRRAKPKPRSRRPSERQPGAPVAATE